MTAHPAKFSDAVLEEIALIVPKDSLVLDPFGGVGKLTNITSIRAVCVEIEPEWANQIVGNALALPFGTATFDAIATSPVYGNRMSDHHNAQDASRRHTYKHYLGRDLHPDNSGQLQWGPSYRVFHVRAWSEAIRCLKPGGTFLLNSSDHIRKGQVQQVTDFHVETLQGLGLVLDKQILIGTPRLRHGHNHETRVDHETVSVLTKGK